MSSRLCRFVRWDVTPLDEVQKNVAQELERMQNQKQHAQQHAQQQQQRKGPVSGEGARGLSKRIWENPHALLAALPAMHLEKAIDQVSLQ